MAPRKPTSRVVFDADPPDTAKTRRSSSKEASAPVATRRSLRIRQKTSPYFTDRAQASVPISDIKTKASKGHKVVASTENAQGKSSSQSRSATSKRKSRATSRKSKTGSRSEEEAPAEEVRVHGLPRQANFYGLIQELVTPNVFRLLVATCLLNQTQGRAAMPVFWELLQKWPDEHSLAQADVVELTELLQPLGLHNIRAKRLIAMSQMMVEVPYDEKNVFRSRDRTAPDTAIGIYPGVGRYAIDSWRIFVAGGGASVGLQGEKPVSPFDTAHRMAVSVTDSKSTASQSSSLPNSAASLKEPEWKSVMPLDKELRAYLIWRWAKEGCVWDPIRGVVSASSDIV